MKKQILLTVIGMFLLLLLIESSSATTDEIRFIAEEDTTLNIKETCSNNNTYCSGSAECNITIRDPKQITVVDREAMTNNIGDYNLTLDGSIINISGVYESTVVCTDGSISGFNTFYFKVTPNGQELSLVQGVIYVILLVIFMILTTFTILGAFYLDGNNQYDFGGKLVKVNVNKYIKMGLFFLSYLFLIVIFLFCKMISEQFLIISFAEGMFNVLYIISIVGLFPVFIGTVALWWLRMIADFYAYKLGKRGLKPR